MSHSRWRVFVWLIAGVGICAFAFWRKAPSTSKESSSPRDSRPNIVLILADDMGFSDIGSYGSEIPTPNLDALAKRGLRFTQFYNAGRCCPSRASLLTGLYAHQTGMGGMTEDLGDPAYQGHLNKQSRTLAELLKANGYSTLMSGKWHLGKASGQQPMDRGFERFFGTLGGGGNYFHEDRGREWILNGQPFDANGSKFYLTDETTDRAVQFLRDAPKEKPFFLYLAYNAPHFPLHARQEDIEKFRGSYTAGWEALRKERHARQMAMGIVKPEWGMAPLDLPARPWAESDDQAEMSLRMAVYAAQVHRMDHGIGQVVEAIRRLGVEENTLVLFLSDNGACATKVERSADRTAVTGTEASFRSYGAGWASAGNTPFRKYKAWVHEGGIATPLLAVWPKGIANGGTVSDRVGHVIDIVPTCLDVAGISAKGIALSPEGKSLKDVFQGEAPQQREPLFWEHEGNRAVRDGDWKLVASRGKPWELYDLGADRGEVQDLASKYPERRDSMEKLYSEWAKRVGVVDPARLKKSTAIATD